MLLALALTALLVTVTGRIAVQTLESQRTLELRARESMRKDLVFDPLAADFRNLLSGLPGDVTPVTVFGTPHPVLQISTLSAVSEEADRLHTVRRPATVRYRLAEKATEENHWRLVREVVDRTSLGSPPTRESIAERLVEFKAEVLSRGKWVNGFAPTESREKAPEAVRVSLRWSDGDTAASRTFLVADAR